jgi:perosamine synthetase
MLPINFPDIQQEDIDRATEVLRSGWLTQGQYVKELEHSVAKYAGTKYAVAVSSGTTALHLALLVAGVKPGNEVIVPAYTFVATANAVRMTGATPVFADIDIRTLCIDPAKIHAAITKNTVAIMPVHAFGLAANMDEIQSIANYHKLMVIEDAACAMGSSIAGRMAGSMGDMGCFSFHGRKIITSGEGGMVVTDNLNFALDLQALRDHGRNNGKCYMIGYNYRMTDFQAALLIGQLGRINETIEVRQSIAADYVTMIAPVVAHQRVPKGHRHNASYHHIISKQADDIRMFLTERGIQTTHGANYIPDEPIYRDLNNPEKYPNSALARKQGVLLPIYEGIPTQKIISCINHTVLAKQ